MVIRSTRNCANTPKVLMALEELGVAYETAVEDDGWFTATFGCPGPVLELGDRTIVEGNAVLRHIGRAHGLQPADLAEADRWLELYRRIGEAARAGDKAAVAHLLGFLDRRLEGRDWLCDDFSIVDCSYLPLTSPWAQRLSLGDFPRLPAYVARIAARPAAARALARTPR